MFAGRIFIAAMQRVTAKGSGTKSNVYRVSFNWIAIISGFPVHFLGMAGTLNGFPILMGYSKLRPGGCEKD
jgi:hypothetical protein